MRWESWYPSKASKAGDKRVKTWFALWPVKIGNDCRWLERVTVEFELKIKKYPWYIGHTYFGMRPMFVWEIVQFVERPNHEQW